MNSQAFLYDKLEKLVKRIPELKLKCTFDEIGMGYYVELSPAGYYFLAVDEINTIVSDFIDRFPYESLTFYQKGEFQTDIKVDRSFSAIES